MNNLNDTSGERDGGSLERVVRRKEIARQLSAALPRHLELCEYGDVLGWQLCWKDFYDKTTTRAVTRYEIVMMNAIAAGDGGVSYLDKLLTAAHKIA